ncbi:glycosyl transferase group 1 [Methanobacterium paludis]|uniref:Glycosyl transferase group 1 n=2 Tax=Methanobacterium paludis (strain DSM 25820 / JCM 18151 / SWAN1) TaxID=868131 RepID=F6D2M3_METPW|nr:glycosyl transferase group 1 [Methanobacterium paludis]
MIPVNFITTWHIKCGIATYSNFLVEEMKNFKDIEIKVHPITQQNSKSPMPFLKIVKEIQKSEITHIQYQPGLFGFVPYLPTFINYIPLMIFLLKFWKRNKIVITVHEFVLDSFLDKLTLKFINLSDKIIVHNKKMADFMIKNGTPCEKFVLMPHGTPEGVFLDKNDAKMSLGLSNKKVLTIFGFVHKNKGHDLVIDILNSLDDDVVLLVAGEARIAEHKKYYNFLKQRSSELGLENRVIFLDYIKDEDLPVVFNSTDIALFPYKWIITSGSFHMALSYNIPTIASDLEYFKEIKDEYGCIELFEQDNKEELVEKIKDLLNNKTKQDYLKSKCSEFYEKTSWKAVAKKTSEIYSDLVESN